MSSSTYKSMHEQYKEAYMKYSAVYGPNTMIFLHGGKFYEIYDLIDPDTGLGATSARRGMELMNIQITEQPGKGPKGELGLFGGVPVKNIHKFAQVLTDQGWHSILLDQDRDEYNNVVNARIPARILGPGTHLEVLGLERRSVASLLLDTEKSKFAASVADLSTGEVFSYQTEAADAILHFFQIYCVKEVIVSWFPLMSQGPEDSYLKSNFGSTLFFHKRPWSSESNFHQPEARENFFRELFRVKSLLPVRAWLGLEGAGQAKPHDLLEMGLCLLLRMLQDHFPKDLDRLLSHEIFQPAQCMRLGNNILEQLNIITNNGQRSILNLIDRSSSALGKRALRERILRPITQPEQLVRYWDQISWASSAAEGATALRLLQRELKRMYDLPRLHHKISEGNLTATDVIQLSQSYSATFKLFKLVDQSPLSPTPSLTQAVDDYFELFQKLIDIEKAYQRQNEIAIGFLTPMSGPKTCAIEDQIAQQVTTWQTLWKKFAIGAGLPPEAFSLVKKTDSWNWEGAKKHLKSLNATEFLKKQSLLTNFQTHSKSSGPISITCKEFYEFESKTRSLEGGLEQSLKFELLSVCDSLWESVSECQREWFTWLGEIDCAVTLALVAADYGWCRPALGENLEIKGLRHPLLETQKTRAEYVRHSVSLGQDAAAARGWLIYGVNASGKSSLMKAVGISVILAQAGSFVPAEAMTLRPYHSAFSRIWSQDNVWAGLSSFAVEVQELREILTQATDRSLVLGDEVCSGTESVSATSLVASTLEYLDEIGAHFMFATHLHDLTKIPGLLPRPGIQVWHLEVREDGKGGLIYDRTLKPGSGSASYGLEVAKAMGLPFGVMNRAYEIRRVLEGSVTAEEAPKSAWNAAIQRKMCEHCGCEAVRELEVHHAVPRAEGGSNELRNLVVLCDTCHDDHHAGRLEIGPAKQTSEGIRREFRIVEPPLTQDIECATGTIGATGATGAATASTEVDTEKDDEDVRLIHITLQKFKGRPDGRVIAALSQQGIHLKPYQLKKFKKQILSP